jgi:hypothetical protein
MVPRVLETAILRRAGADENAVKGLRARAHTIFCAAKKRPFHGRFCNCAKIAQLVVAMRVMRATHVARKTTRAATSGRETPPRTRFVNAEAVFFVVL